MAGSQGILQNQYFTRLFDGNFQFFEYIRQTWVGEPVSGQTFKVVGQQAAGRNYMWTSVCTETHIAQICALQIR